MTTVTDETERYNGWTNYETWAVKLWMDNEQPSQEHWAAEARRCYETANGDPILTKRQRATVTLEERIKDAHETGNPMDEEGDASVYSDLMNAALGRVNWYEIAQAIIEDNIEDWKGGAA